MDAQIGYSCANSKKLKSPAVMRIMVKNAELIFLKLELLSPNKHMPSSANAKNATESMMKKEAKSVKA